jgi:hypothetical protein
MDVTPNINALYSNINIIFYRPTDMDVTPNINALYSNINIIFYRPTDMDVTPNINALIVTLTSYSTDLQTSL